VAQPGLAGEWFLLATEDEKRADVGSELIRMTVTEAGKVRFRFGKVETNSGTFVHAKGAGETKAVDLKLSNGKVYRGVYALEGDDLVMCFAEEGKARPAGLRPKGAQWVERWKRVGRPR
jgi:uncharacterized protein (TIGR03067 family)